MIIETLEKFGLSNNEAKVYITLLELGPSVVSNIAKKAAINRSTAYVVLGFLVTRGFVSTSDVKNIRIYTAASPERLLQKAKEAAKKQGDLVDMAKSLIPKLKSLQGKTKERPKTQFFEGEQGIETVYRELFNEKKDIPSTADILIDSDKVALISPTEKFAVVISSKEIAEVMKKKLR